MGWRPTTGTDSDAIHDNVAGEIAAIAAATPIAADSIVFEDDSDSDNKKSSALSDIDLDQMSSGGATDGHVATADGAGAVAWEAAGGGGFTYSGASVTGTTDQAISADTATAIQFNAETWDTDTYHDNVTNNTRLTVPSTDKYLVTGNVMATGLDADNYQIQLYVNGALVARIWRGIPGQATQNISFARQLDLTISDYVEVIVFQSNTAFVIDRDRCDAQIVKLG